MKRSQDKNQLSLFSEPEPQVFYTFSLTDQIARDMETLRMDPTFWVPSREFYEERIESYRAEVKRQMGIQ